MGPVVGGDVGADELRVAVVVLRPEEGDDGLAVGFGGGDVGLGVGGPVGQVVVELVERGEDDVDFLGEAVEPAVLGFPPGEFVGAVADGGPVVTGGEDSVEPDAGAGRGVLSEGAEQVDVAVDVGLGDGGVGVAGVPVFDVDADEGAGLGERLGDAADRLVVDLGLVVAGGPEPGGVDDVESAVGGLAEDV
ncbi:MAG: hypothetical protein AAF750_16425 [Planctomycetota bacterium]